MQWWSLRGGQNRLPEVDLTPTGLVQVAVGFADVGAGGEELAVGGEGVGDFVVGVGSVKREEIEAAAVRVELEDGAAGSGRVGRHSRWMCRGKCSARSTGRRACLKDEAR